MIAIISQARVNSTRLPNKIFMEARGRTFLWYHVERLKKAGLPIIIATTNNGSEKPIVDFCKENKLLFTQSDEKNVLKRFYDAAVEHEVKTIIRVTSDCPLIDGELITNGLNSYYQHNERTYYSNTLERTYPRGMDYEIFSFELLEEAFKNATDESDKEHVTPYIWKNKPGNVIIDQDTGEEDNSMYRLTLDTEEDRVLLTRLIEEYDADKMRCNGMVKILKDDPSLFEINRHIEQKKI